MILPVAVMIMSGLRQLPQLGDQPAAGPTPALTVIVPALNEADTIEPALRTLLASNYPNLEIIAVNDRSTDQTGPILDSLAQEDARLRIIHIASLPPGWLGKSYALHLGARQAQGDFLLFTDADIRFSPDALQQAVAYAVTNELDHLTVLPDLQAKAPLLQMLLLQFLVGFLLFFQPWRVRHDARRYVGVGAFNLVRKTLYERVGGHRAVAMTPLDDTLLGKQLKRAGARADALLGSQAVMVDWYPSTAAMIRGLGKNGFAAFDYRLSRLLTGSLLIGLGALWPVAGLFFGTWLGKTASAGALLLGAAMLHQLIRQADWPNWILLLAPIGTLVSLYIFWRSALLALTRGSVEWRGTRYPLDDLKTRHF